MGEESSRRVYEVDGTTARKRFGQIGEPGYSGATVDNADGGIPIPIVVIVSPKQVGADAAPWGV